MEKRPLLEKSPTGIKIIVLLLLVFSSIIFVFLVGLLIAVPIFGGDIFDKLSMVSNPSTVEMINFSKYLQLVSQLGFFIVPSLIFAFLVNKKISQYLKINVNISGFTLVLTIALTFLGMPFINWLAELNSGLQLPESMKSIEEWMKTTEENAKVLVEKFLEVETIGGLLINIFIIAIIPAIGEEFLFRGVLQRLFHDWSKNIHIAVFVTGFLFSFIHFQFYGFLPRMLLGVIFGYLFAWSGSLWIPIAAHFVNNAFAVIAFYLLNKGLIEMDIDKVGTEGSNVSIALTGLIFVIAILFAIYKWENKRKTIKNHNSLQR